MSDTPQTGSEPPVYSWQPASGQHPWLPAPPPPQWPPTPLPHSPTAPARRREGGIAGGIVAGLAAFLKYGVIFLKVGKLGPTLISMIIALFFYAIFFGPAFGLGIVLLILVHESGHVLFAKFEGLPMSAPVFIPFLGAFTKMHRQPADARQEAVVAIGGPVVGTAGALICFVWAEAVPPGHLHYLLLALAYFGCFVNLFNLIPMSPLDGGRVATALSKWMNVVGLVIMAGFVLFVGNTIALIILILGAFTTFQRFRNARRGLEPPPVAPSTRLWIGAAYLTMLLVALGGMTLAHNAQVNGHFVPGVTQTTDGG